MPDHVPLKTEIVAYDHGDAPGLTVRGEIDIATSPQLKVALDKAIRETTGAFVLDLCDVEFLDGSGLTVVLRARAALAREGRPLTILCPPGPGPVRRVMELAGVDDLLRVHDSRAGCGGPRSFPLTECATASAGPSRKPSRVPGFRILTGTATRLA